MQLLKNKIRRTPEIQGEGTSPEHGYLQVLYSGLQPTLSGAGSVQTDTPKLTA